MVRYKCVYYYYIIIIIITKTRESTLWKQQ